MSYKNGFGWAGYPSRANFRWQDSSNRTWTIESINSGHLRNVQRYLHDHARTPLDPAYLRYPTSLRLAREVVDGEVRRRRLTMKAPVRCDHVALHNCLYAGDWMHHQHPNHVAPVAEPFIDPRRTGHDIMPMPRQVEDRPRVATGVVMQALSRAIRDVPNGGYTLSYGNQIASVDVRWRDA